MANQYHSLLREPVVPKSVTRGRHCHYMEQLRRSIQHLQRQTSTSTLPSSLVTPSVNSKRHSVTPSSDTLGTSFRTRDSPECMVVYEPYHTPSPSTTSSSRGSNSFRGYRSSSSASGSSADCHKGETPTNLFEDSGVELGDSYSSRYLSAYDKNKIGNYNSSSQDEDHKSFNRRHYELPKQRTKNQSSFKPFKGDSCVETVKTQVPSYLCKHLRKKDFFASSPSLKSKDIGQTSSDESDNYVVLRRKRDEFVSKQGKGNKYTCESEFLRAKSLENLDSSRDGSTYLTGKLADHVNAHEVGGVCFCTSDHETKRLSLNDTESLSKAFIPHVKLSNDTYDSSKEEIYEFDVNLKDPSFEQNEMFVDTPNVTPIPEKQVDLNVQVSTQGCQTNKSVFQRQRKGGFNDKCQRNDKNKEGKATYPCANDNLVRTSLTVIEKPSKTFSKKRQEEKTDMNMFENLDDTWNFVRSGSIRSIVSITDTMSVTSMEVANIMSVGDTAKKSAVTLEKERLKLQHQRLQSYQELDQEDEPDDEYLSSNSQPKSIYDACYSDESLRKRKIVTSVLENLPLGVNYKTAGPKNIHNFVAQSLQTFFTEKQKDSIPPKGLPASNGAFTKGRPMQDNVHRVIRHNGQNDTSSPSLYQLTTSFRLFHVSYGDPSDLLNMRLITCGRELQQLSSPSAHLTDKQTQSYGAWERGRDKRLQSDRKCLPGIWYNFLVIAELRNYRMEMDEGGLQPGDHIIEVNDKCMLNQTPDGFFDVLEKASLVHLVIGRRRQQQKLTSGFNTTDTCYGDSCML